MWSTPIDISKWLVHIQNSFSDDYQNPILNKETYEWPSYKTNLRKEISISKKDLKECPGRYGTGQEKNDIYDVVVSEENGELFICFGYASIPYKLHKAEENKFFLIETGFEVLFYEENGATKKLVVVIQAGFDRHFNKFE